MPTRKKTIKQKKETGSYRPNKDDKINNVITKEIIKIEIPEHYLPQTKKEFQKIATYLQTFLTEIDLTSLYDIFNLYNENQKIYAQLQKTEIIKPEYQKLFVIYQQGIRTFNVIMKQYGGTPSERSKIADLIPPEKTENSILDLLQ